jgi:hypothetical protein
VAPFPSFLDLEGFPEEAKRPRIPEKCNPVSLTKTCAFHSRARLRLSLLDLLGDHPGSTACMCTLYLLPSAQFIDFIVMSWDVDTPRR